MKGLKRHLSYANVAATLALVFAMTGGAIAATGGFTSGGKLQACVGSGGTLKLLKSGRRCHPGQQRVSWSQTGPRGPAGPSGLAGQTGASPTIPGKVSAAETALTASNALSLGGIPASDFTRRDCASLTGQIKGFATIPAGAGHDEAFHPISPSYNCSGGAVEARYLAQGNYEIRFVGNPAAIAVATVSAPPEGLRPDVATVQLIENGVWRVEIYDIGEKEDVNAPVSLILP
ncbi:MAG TPA: hypothetical protein VN618_12270 [Solirubrobacteraceae bacterium]|nr:hypothetical protein [Solirubrobacteraceae bacterium]